MSIDTSTPAALNIAEFAAAGCQARGQEALALDWNLRTASGEWGFLGQLEGSVQEGGDAAGRQVGSAHSDL